MLGGGLDWGPAPAAAEGGLPLYQQDGGAAPKGGWDLGGTARRALWDAYCGASDPLIVFAALSGLLYSV